MKNATVVIPAYNEENTVGSIVKGIFQNCNKFVKEIIVVDDGSVDDTVSIAQSNGASVITHSYNLGYGASLKTGISNADSEYIITIDADGQHDPNDILKLWDFAKDNDMVIGQRVKLFHSRIWRMPGKWLIGRLANYLTKRKIPDINSGMRIFKRDMVKKYMHLCPSGFSFSTTITMIFLSQGLRVEFCPINILKRSGNKSLVSVSTGFDTIIFILRIVSLFNPLRIFLPISLIIGTTGLLWGIPYIFMRKGVSVGSLLMLITSIIIFMMGLLCDQISQLRLEKFK